MNIRVLLARGTAHFDIACLCALISLAACSKGAPASPPRSSHAWDVFVEEHIEASLRRDPVFAAFEGRHEFDGQVPDFALSAIEARIAEERTFRERAKAFDPSPLSREQRFE